VDTFGPKKRTKSQIGKASKAKGAAGERELAHFLSFHKFPAIRGVQYQGGKDSPDIKCDRLSMFQIECKRTEKLSIYKAVVQCEEDCGPGQLPLVCHRQNGRPWISILRTEDFLNIMDELIELRETVDAQSN